MICIIRSRLKKYGLDNLYSIGGESISFEPEEEEELEYRDEHDEV